jgi:hypothetical protein
MSTEANDELVAVELEFVERSGECRYKRESRSSHASSSHVDRLRTDRCLY